MEVAFTVTVLLKMPLLLPLALMVPPASVMGLKICTALATNSGAFAAVGPLRVTEPPVKPVVVPKPSPATL